MPADFGELWPFAATQPILLTLREHHCVGAEHPARVGGPPGDTFDDGVCNGWFVEQTTFRNTSVRARRAMWSRVRARADLDAEGHGGQGRRRRD
jgi:hypothetical protein